MKFFNGGAKRARDSVQICRDVENLPVAEPIKEFVSRFVHALRDRHATVDKFGVAVHVVGAKDGDAYTDVTAIEISTTVGLLERGVFKGELVPAMWPDGMRWEIDVAGSGVFRVVVART